VVLGFKVQEDTEVYKYYPSGLINAFSKLGGLLAFLKIGALLNYMHKRWFDNEIDKVITQSKIAPVKVKDEDEETGKKKKKTKKKT
jgi:hypothetical protein